MPRLNPIRTSFVAGEISPRLEGRAQLEQLSQALRQSRNGVVLPHGGYQRRSGTRFVDAAKNAGGEVVLRSFIPTVGEGIIIEMGANYFRFFQDGAMLLDGAGNPLEIATPYGADELRDIQMAQSIDVAWIVHPDHFPQKLSRTSVDPTAFTLEPVEFRDGHAPLRSPNGNLFNPVDLDTSTTPFTLKWNSDPVDGGLDTTGNFDTGRAVRADDGVNIGWYRIDNVTASNQAEVTLLGGSGPVAFGINVIKSTDPLILETNNIHDLVEGDRIRLDDLGLTDSLFIVGEQPTTNDGSVLLKQFQVNTFPGNQPFSGSSATTGTAPKATRTPTDWSVGLFSEKEGARAITFHEGRLVYGGSLQEVDRLSFSVSDDFDNFELVSTALDLRDAEAADRAIERRTVSTANNSIQWLQAANRRLFVGTSGGEFIVQGENRDLLTPSGTQVVQATARGSIHLPPAVIDNQVVFVQQNGKKLRRLTFDASADGQVAEDISIFAEHITEGTIFDMAYQQDPDSVLWALRGDGRLIGFTLEGQQRVIGAHLHEVGGEFSGLAAVVESVATLPSPAGLDQNQVWVSVRRTINGATVRYVEALEKVFQPRSGFASTDQERVRDLEDAVFMDSALSLDSPISVANIEQAATPTITTETAHGLTAGDSVRIRDAVGMTQINQVTTQVDSVTGSNTFTIAQDTTDFGPYKGFGTVRKEFSSFSGLDHLEGQEVLILADGAVHPSRVVSNGEVELTRTASIVHVGLRMPFFFETTRIIPLGQSGRIGTLHGQEMRIQRVSMRLHETMGGEVAVGPTPEDGDFSPLIFREAASRMDRAIPIFTGDKEVAVEGGWTTEPTLFVRNDQPLPMTVLALMPRMEANEG